MVNLSKSTPSGNIFLYSSYNIIIQSMQQKELTVFYYPHIMKP